MSNCEDIKKGWLSVARRLQEFCSHARGRAKFVTITITVDADNEPIFWLNPKMRKIEPKMDREALLRLLCDMSDTESAEIV